MFNAKDPYTLTSYRPLYWNDSDGQLFEIGTLATKYEARVFNDVQVPALGATSSKDQQFILTCTQRIYMTHNLGLPAIAPAGPSGATADYPAIVQAQMWVPMSGNGVTVELLEYSPHSVNTAIQQSANANNSSGTSGSVSTTTGSSFSQSNTFSASASIGMQGPSVTVEASETSMRERSRSQTGETGSSRSMEHGDSDTMSMKEWGSYAGFDYSTNSPLWTFGQEYPWNALQCRTPGDPTLTPPDIGKVAVCISAAMRTNLQDGTAVRLPSDLSVYGLNFVTKAKWRIYVDSATASAQITNVSVNHPVSYYSATHLLDSTSGEVNVFIDRDPTMLLASRDNDGSNSVSFDLNLLALDPVGTNHDAAAMGFIPSRFIPPGANGSALYQNFKILSRTNDLMITDTTAYASGDSTGFSLGNNCLIVGWPHQQKPFDLTLSFKVIDLVEEYTLNLKHWIAAGAGVKLTFTINGDTDNPLVRYVQETEGNGGDNNMLSIALRDLDFSSINYHDFLVLGLNSIAVQIEPANGDWTTSLYQLRAVSIVRH